MKIHVVGGGPAGLYFALLMQRRGGGAHEITVFERNAASSTFGWGVVFSRRTLDVLRDSDPETCRALEARAVQWEDVVVALREETLHIGGNHFVGIERIVLLNILQEICHSLGVELRFEHEVASPEVLRDCDLLVGADGVRSAVREAYRSAFRPTLEPRRNRYCWLGTGQPFSGLTLTFRPHASGLFIAHSYRFSDRMSTFIVECSEDTFAKAGLEDLPEREALALLEEVFAPDLGGHPLQSNASRWVQFVLVKNEHWYHENVVLLGDACHTAHFSVGSGTKLALEDSIALARALQESDGVAAGLAAYQARRKPVVDDFQESAFASLRWFETAAEKLHLDPIVFAMDLMTRSDRLDVERVRRRDPAFVAAYERHVNAS